VAQRVLWGVHTVLAFVLLLLPLAARGAESLVVEGAEDYPRCSKADDATVKALARGKRLRGVRSLRIAASADGIRELARSKHLGKVRTLSVCTEEAGVAALATSRYLGSVTELTIFSEDPLRPETVKRLVTSRHLRKLRILRFVAGDSEAEKTLDPVGLRALVRHAALPRLVELDLAWNALDQDSVVALVQSKLAARLQRLNLCQTAFGRAAADALIAEQPRLSRLRRLCVSYGIVGGPAEELDRVRSAYDSVVETDWEAWHSR